MKINNKKRDNSKIRNLEDLRAAKRKLRSEINLSESKSENSYANRTINFVSNLGAGSTFTSSSVENALNWFSNRALKKYRKNRLSKVLISGLIMVAVPIITRKIHEYIENKFKKTS